MTLTPAQREAVRATLDAILQEKAYVRTSNINLPQHGMSKEELDESFQVLFKLIESWASERGEASAEPSERAEDMAEVGL